MSATEYPLKREERAVFALRAMYQRYGYRPFKMSKFEEYDLYVRNKDFLVSDGVITFTDTDGRLMALKPDVTLSIIKNSRDLPGCVQKLHYSENVYRVSGSTRSFKEIMQTGIECLGDIALYELCEVIMLASKSLYAIDPSGVLELSHLGVVAALLDELGLDDETRAAALKCIGEKNADGIRKLCPGQPMDGVLALIAAHGEPARVIEALKPWCAEGRAREALDELAAVTGVLADAGCRGVEIDFSIVNDMRYYNGIVFQGFIAGVPSGVLSGGQYDKLMRRMGRKSRAVGFAVYLDLLERLGDDGPSYDVDAVLLYDDGADVSALTQAIRALTDSGRSVLAQRVVPERLRFRQLLRFKDGGIETLETHD